MHVLPKQFFRFSKNRLLIKLYKSKLPLSSYASIILLLNKVIFIKLYAGTQGKVYKIDSQRCIKIFKRKQICADEIETLAMAQIDSHFPKLYEFGNEYIIREYIDGIELDKYLLSHPLTPEISRKIIEIYEAMNIVGFSRLDAALFHIFLTPSDGIKLIDTARAMKKESIYPSLIIKGLRDLGYKKQFLDFVKTNKPDLYVKWSKYCN
jgi:RIO-like serine/threonine protein kinase